MTFDFIQIFFIPLESINTCSNIDYLPYSNKLATIWLKETSSIH